VGSDACITNNVGVWQAPSHSRTGGRGDQEYIRDANILSHNIYNAPQKGQAGCRAFGKVPGIREPIRRREACYSL